jgi:hypothetical protein
MIVALFRSIPLWFWLALAVAAATVAGVFAIDQNGYHRGAAVVQAKWDADRAALQTALAKEKERQAQVVTNTVIEYRDRVQVIKERGKETVREVEKLVPVGTCTLPGAFRLLHDAAATGSQLPADPGPLAATTDAVEAIAALETVIENYTQCRSDAERLTALQSLVKELSHAHSSP